MNTKYPLNGRGATLGDLVHEFAHISAIPENMEGTKHVIFPYTEGNMPFLHILYDNIISQERNIKFPYELVWFDNVYSTTEKDDETNKFKIIQESDSGAYSFDRFIVSQDVIDKTKIIGDGIKFRFIIPSIEENEVVSHESEAYNIRGTRYYYNYKTSYGEATVMYALQLIIDTVCEIEKTPNLFNSTKDDGTLNPELGKDVKTSSNILSKIFKDGVNGLPPIITTEDTIFTEDYKVLPGAYQYLGSFDWTIRCVNYENYTSKTFETFNLSNLPEKELKKITELASVIFGNIDKENKKQYVKLYVNNDDAKIKKNNLYYKFLYFANMFLDSQRFFVSYITMFEYVNISGKSYSKNAPILRCDLGTIKVIESLSVNTVSIKHMNPLPAGPLNGNTKIDIHFMYDITYKGLGSTPYTEETTLSYSLNTIYSNSGNALDNPNKKPVFRFASPFNEIDFVTTYEEIEGNITRKTSFNNPDYAITYGTALFRLCINPVISTTYSDSSLGSLQWPITTEVELKCPDLKTFEEYIQNIEYSSNTAEKTNFSNYSTNFNKFSSSAPLGFLLVQDYINKQQINSMFTIKVPLYRMHNYYYIQTAGSGTTAKSFDFNMYFDPKTSQGFSNIHIETVKGKSTDNIDDIIQLLKSKMPCPIFPCAESSDDIFGYAEIGEASMVRYASGTIKKETDAANVSTYTSSIKLTYYIDGNSKDFSPSNKIFNSPSGTSVHYSSGYSDGKISTTSLRNFYLCRISSDSSEEKEDLKDYIYFLKTGYTNETTDIRFLKHRNGTDNDIKKLNIIMYNNLFQTVCHGIKEDEEGKFKISMVGAHLTETSYNDLIFSSPTTKQLYICHLFQDELTDDGKVGTYNIVCSRHILFDTYIPSPSTVIKNPLITYISNYFINAICPYVYILDGEGKPFSFGGDGKPSGAKLIGSNITKVLKSNAVIFVADNSDITIKPENFAYYPNITESEATEINSDTSNKLSDWISDNSQTNFIDVSLYTYRLPYVKASYDNAPPIGSGDGDTIEKTEYNINNAKITAGNWDKGILCMYMVINMNEKHEYSVFMVDTTYYTVSFNKQTMYEDDTYPIEITIKSKSGYSISDKLARPFGGSVSTNSIDDGMIIIVKNNYFNSENNTLNLNNTIDVIFKVENKETLMNLVFENDKYTGFGSIGYSADDRLSPVDGYGGLENKIKFNTELPVYMAIDKLYYNLQGSTRKTEIPEETGDYPYSVTLTTDNVEISAKYKYKITINGRNCGINTYVWLKVGDSSDKIELKPAAGFAFNYDIDKNNNNISYVYDGSHVSIKLSSTLDQEGEITFICSEVPPATNVISYNLITKDKDGNVVSTSDVYLQNIVMSSTVGTEISFKVIKPENYEIKSVETTVPAVTPTLSGSETSKDISFIMPDSAITITINIVAPETPPVPDDGTTGDDEDDEDDETTESGEETEGSEDTDDSEETP